MYREPAPGSIRVSRVTRRCESPHRQVGSPSPRTDQRDRTTSIQNLSLAAGLAALVALPSATRAEATVKEADTAIAALKKADPSLEKFFGKTAGYAVFPNVAKGGLVIGGQKFSYEPLGAKKK